MSFPFTYKPLTTLPDGLYVVDFDGERTVADYENGTWSQLGIDYDVWQYSPHLANRPIRVIARIDVQELTFEPYKGAST